MSERTRKRSFSVGIREEAFKKIEEWAKKEGYKMTEVKLRIVGEGAVALGILSDKDEVR